MGSSWKDAEFMGSLLQFVQHTVTSRWGEELERGTDRVLEDLRMKT